jgi:hypothetical protein
MRVLADTAVDVSSALYALTRTYAGVSEPEQVEEGGLRAEVERTNGT